MIKGLYSIRYEGKTATQHMTGDRNHWRGLTKKQRPYIIKKKGDNNADEEDEEQKMGWMVLLLGV